MTQDQIIIFALFGSVFALLLWGRFRYDIVAFSALMIGVLLGVVEGKDAFAGFGHPATLVVALVLVVSAGLVRSGAVFLITRTLVDRSRNLGGHIALMGGYWWRFVSFYEQRRSPRTAHARRYPNRTQSRARTGFVADATQLCHYPWWHGHADWHTS